MSSIRSGPLVGLAGQLLLLAALNRTVGLGAAGWVVGTAFGLVMCAALSQGLRQSGRAALGQADRVTLFRATLVGAVASLTADSFTRPVPVALMVVTAAVALALDGVDGQVARRTGTASEFGARFDMEVDAFLILVLSVCAARPAGGWVLAIGAMRYVYAAAGRVLPWLDGPLAPRYWRKAVAAAQGIVLVVAAAGVLPGPVLSAVLAVSLALLTASFASCVGLLWSQRPVAQRPDAQVRPAPAVAAAVLPAQLRRAPAVPAQAVPAHAVPAHAVPAGTVPVHAVPAHAVPAARRRATVGRPGGGTHRLRVPRSGGRALPMAVPVTLAMAAPKSAP